MVPIKIQGKKYRIKSIVELSTAEFIELSKIENLDTLKYIAWQTKVKFKEAFFAKISSAVEKGIGSVPDIRKLKKPKRKDIDYSKLIETVGQRHQVESCGLEGYELLVFVLAVSQAKSNSIDDVNKLKDRYMSESFLQILPAGFFFFRILQNGRKRGLGFLKRSLFSIKTKSLKNQRVQVG